MYDVDQLKLNKKDKVDVYDILQIRNKEVKYITECWSLESWLSLTSFSIFNNIYIVDKFLLISYKRKRSKRKQNLENIEILSKLLNTTEVSLVKKLKNESNTKKKKEKSILLQEEKILVEGKTKESWKSHSTLLRLLKDNSYYFVVYHPLNYAISIYIFNLFFITL